MQELSTLLDQLKAAGITPRVEITLTPQPPDAAAIISLHKDLKGAGIAPEIHFHIHLTQAGEALPPQETNLPEEAGQPVMVNVTKTNLMEFRRKDNAGKPIMEIHEPRIQLMSGTRLSVSTTHKAGDKDTGDGVVLGTGGFKFHFIVDCPSKPEARGFYIRQTDVTKV